MPKLSKEQEIKEMPNFQRYLRVTEVKLTYIKRCCSCISIEMLP